MSEYGFLFSDGPHARGRFHAWMSRSRPVFARPFINTAGRCLRRSAVAPTLLAYCRAVLPGEWCMDRLLDLQRLPGNERSDARRVGIECARTCSSRWSPSPSKNNNLKTEVHTYHKYP